MKKYMIYLTILLILSGCAINNQPIKSNPSLPIVNNFKAYPDRNAIALRWKIIKDTRIKGYYIERLENNKWKLIKTINNPYKSIFVDTNLNPNTLYQYKIASFNKDHIPSLGIKTATKTLPRIAPVIPLEIKPIKKGMIKIIFRPHMNERVKGYIIERRSESKPFKKIATLTPRYNVEYIDTNLKDGIEYEYIITAFTFDNIYSKPSEIISTSTFKEPLPVNQIIATTNQPKKIIIRWEKVPNAAYYKVYKKSFIGYKFIAKTKKNLYIDNIKKDGVTEIYKVTAVTSYGTESPIDKSKPVIGRTLTIPKKPVTIVNYFKDYIEISFRSTDKRAYIYKIVKEIKNGLNKKEVIFFTKKPKFIDKHVKPDKSYTYRIYVIDKNGLISKPVIVKVEL